MSVMTTVDNATPPVTGEPTPPVSRKLKSPQGPRYRALKKITVGGKVYKPGQVVPEAKTWLRVEAWVRSRHLELVE